MRIAFLYLYIFAIISGCSLDNLEPSQTNTFLKFYSETNEMESKDLIVLNDGFLVLSTYSESSSLLMKTDLLGNKLWAQSINDFLGSSLVEIADGYILIGDGINSDDDSTYMQLIKTDFDGGINTTIQVGYGAQHGSAIMLSSTNEIIALGYTSTGQLNDSNDSTYVIINGYDTNLTKTWDEIRQYPVFGVDIIPSKSLYESNNGKLNWISYSSQDEIITNTDLTAISPDAAPVGNLPLFDQNSAANFEGDLVKTSVGFAMVQTVAENGFKIGIATSINGVVMDEFVIPLEFNSIVSSITNTSNGLLIAATSDNHEERERSDWNLLLLEVDINGQAKTNGINVSYGGDGDEIPVRIRNAKDGGYVVLGTSVNTKGAKQTFILKTNKNGLLE